MAYSHPYSEHIRAISKLIKTKQFNINVNDIIGVLDDRVVVKQSTKIIDNNDIIAIINNMMLRLIASQLDSDSYDLNIFQEGSIPVLYIINNIIPVYLKNIVNDNNTHIENDIIDFYNILCVLYFFKTISDTDSIMNQINELIDSYTININTLIN